MSEEDRKAAESLADELADLARDMNTAIATRGSEGVPALRVLIERGNSLLERPDILERYRNHTLGPAQSATVSTITILLTLRELSREIDEGQFALVERLAELCLELGSSMSIGLGSFAFRTGESRGGDQAIKASTSRAAIEGHKALNAEKERARAAFDKLADEEPGFRRMRRDDQVEKIKSLHRFSKLTHSGIKATIVKHDPNKRPPGRPKAGK